jgi:low temperature requirement protein LtrA
VDQNRQSRVDQNALKFNQLAIVSLVIVAFILGGQVGGIIVGALGLALGLGSAFPGKGPLQLVYRAIRSSSSVVKPSFRSDDPSQHRFAQAMGSVCLLVSAVLILAGASAAGWTLAFLVMALALVNLVFNFCAGCFIYLHLERARRRLNPA